MTPAAIPFFQRAVSLDPNFAMAYLLMGDEPTSTLVRTPGQPKVCARPMSCGDARASRKSSSFPPTYEAQSTGNLEAARTAYELWAQTYPRSTPSPRVLPFGHLRLSWETTRKRSAAAQEVAEARPRRRAQIRESGYAYLLLNRLDEAQSHRAAGPRSKSRRAFHSSDSLLDRFPSAR